MVETPPPVYAGPQKKSKTGLVIGIVAACLLLTCGCCAFGGWFFIQKGAPIASCQQTFMVAQQSVQDYAEAHDGKLPNPETWQDDVRSYYAKRAIKTKNPIFAISDANGVWSCKTGDIPTGIAFNSDLKGKKMTDVKEPYSTPMLFEIPTPSMNAHGPYKDDPNHPTMMGKSRPWFVANVEGRVRVPGSNADFNTNSGDSGN